MKIKNAAVTLGIIIFLTVLLATPVMADSLRDVSRQLICQCGCSAILNDCSHAECGAREAMTALIAQRLSQGQPPAEIVRYFVARYGEQVLAAPPKKGFNLTAWLLPLAALLVGVGVIYAALRRWVWRGHHPPTAPVSRETAEEYQRRLDNELANFSEGAFR